MSTPSEVMEDEHSGREANKICGVCGDRALGYNFNAVSCESCKAFFRRNALKNKDFRCPFTENCNITPVTRRFCQKCRLDKCFVIGMKKEYIMSEEDKVLKRQKIEQNRARKRPTSENQKAPKMKKENEYDTNFDDTSSSIPSVASATPDSYFWDCNKKYTDLDASKHTTLDNMSPETAASVPSPSSPSENCDIAGSKTLDMLKDSSFNSSSYSKNGSGTGYSNSESGERNSVCRSNDEASCSDLEMESPGTTTAEDVGTPFKESQRTDDDSVDNFSSPIVSHFEESPSTCSRFKDSVELHGHPPARSAMYSNSRAECCVTHGDFHTIADENMNQSSLDPKQNVTNVKQSDLPTIIDNSYFLEKLASSPDLIAKIIKNKKILTKLVNDPELMEGLANDPQFSEFFVNHSVSKNPEIENHKADSNGALPNTYIKHPSNNVFQQLGGSHPCKNPILTNLITNGIHDACKHQDVSSPYNESIDMTQDVLQDVRNIPIAANSIESILCEAIKLEFSAYSSIGGSQSSRELNDAERAKLNELIVANKALLAPLDDDIMNLVGDECRFKGHPGQSDPMLLDVINLTAIAIRRLIKMAKKIHAFKNMCQEDQLALLKGGCTEMMILRSASTYEPDKDVWKIPHSQERMSKIKTDVLKEASGNLYAEHSKFVRTFDPRWRDENIILILSAIALFTPDRQKVVHSDVIKLEQNSYYYLLRRYLESIYPGCEAKSMFLNLIQKISELHRLNAEVVGVYLNVNPSSVEPLLIEIFDLKH